MKLANRDYIISKILGFGAAFATIFLISDSVTDPVNAPKLMVIGVVALATIGVLISSGIQKVFAENKIVSVLLVTFGGLSSITLITSNSPMSQGIYGVYGRNNGLLTYLCLVGIMFAALSLNSITSFNSIISGLLFAGLVNVAYCLWVVSFGDFIGWSNPYGNILGTLGNPNFVGSFLGIFLTAYLAYSLRPDASRVIKFSALMIVPVTAFEIVKSNAIQGRVVAALGLGILGFLLIRARLGKFVLALYSLLIVVVGSFSLLGALQIGPLTSLIYKTSVSLRGQYWLAGWNTGTSHPFSGVGMDAFGDWYRRSRDIHALELPGVNTVVNASHNVPLDIFAFGGWPLFITYMVIMIWAGVCGTRIIIRNKDFDANFAIIFTAWTGYQLQSIISINQIGLAVWGWLLSGVLISYERISRKSNSASEKASNPSQKTNKSATASPLFVISAALGGLTGLLLAIPPLTSDSHWRSAQLARNLEKIEGSMKNSYFNPPNSMKYFSNIQILEESQLFDLSRKYALEGTKWNPESFELWKVLYLIKNSSAEEKALALENMKRLDPLNPDVTSIK